MYDETLTRDLPRIESTEVAQLDRTESIDPFEDDTPIVCGVEDVDTCEACQ